MLVGACQSFQFYSQLAWVPYFLGYLVFSVRLRFHYSYKAKTCLKFVCATFLMSKSKLQVKAFVILLFYLEQVIRNFAQR